MELLTTFALCCFTGDERASLTAAAAAAARRSESIRTGFLLSQGGEFAFVLLSLACQLKLLPEELNQILIITGEGSVKPIMYYVLYDHMVLKVQ
jgi:Kef-type K+ transport system membrane component KefB